MYQRRLVFVERLKAGNQKIDQTERQQRAVLAGEVTNIFYEF